MRSPSTRATQGASRASGRLLGRELRDDDRGGVELLPTTDSGFRLRFVASPEPKTGQNPMHLHLTSDSLEDQAATVARALDLGAHHLDVGQLPEEEHVVLADPEGNELCVIEPGNSFLAGCGFEGELTCDGSRAVGHFWSQALGWPLVWDQDEETAIQSPQGGTKISWGGPPVAPKTGKARLHYDLVPGRGAPRPRRSSGWSPSARHARTSGRGDVTWTVLADPDGNEFCVLPSP